MFIKASMLLVAASAINQKSAMSSNQLLLQKLITSDAWNEDTGMGYNN